MSKLHCHLSVGVEPESVGIFSRTYKVWCFCCFYPVVSFQLIISVPYQACCDNTLPPPISPFHPLSSPILFSVIFPISKMSAEGDHMTRLHTADIELGYSEALLKHLSRHVVPPKRVSQRKLDFEHSRPRILRECMAEATGVFFYV
jgi:hypothetical protein